jgi:hypothetical protein
MKDHRALSLCIGHISGDPSFLISQGNISDEITAESPAF